MRRNLTFHSIEVPKDHTSEQRVVYLLMHCLPILNKKKEMARYAVSRDLACPHVFNLLCYRLDTLGHSGTSVCPSF
jgi:hypothetical protein